MNEFAFIDFLKKKSLRSKGILLGIGDDASVLCVERGKQLVVSTDAIVENVDFILKKLSPEKIGRKVLAINLSDMAAMGANPTAFVIVIGKPRYISTAWLKRFYGGLLKLAKQYDVACIGGDFSSAKEFFASVTILGEVKPGRAVSRAGAKAGDWIGITGKLGGSILRHHYSFSPRVSEGRFLGEGRWVNSMIDVSDGLIQDLTHILKASNVGAVLDLEKIPVSMDAKKLSKGKKTGALNRALSDGENFELLFTMLPRQKKVFEKNWKKRFPKVPLCWIGKIGGGESVIRWMKNGKITSVPKLSKTGYSHF